MFSVKPANFEEFECRAQTRIGQVLRYPEIQWLQILKMTRQFVVFFGLLFVLVEIAILWIIAGIPLFWSLGCQFSIVF